MNTDTALHVVVGTGQIGTHLAEHLLAKGRRVRVVSRRSGWSGAAGVEDVRGDVTDRTFIDSALSDAAVVYNVANPPRYDVWPEVLPALSRAIRDGAARAGARLVVLDNLYMVGVPAGGVIREDAPLAPCSKKGELRARLARELEEMVARGDLRATTGRASDFFGPGTLRAAIFGPRFFERLARGQSLEVFGDPDLPHAYSYAPDVAAGLAVLGTYEQATGGVWHLPAAWNGSTRALVERFAAAAGVTPRLRRVPGWLVGAVGLFNGEVGAAREMLYQWHVPYVLDDARLRAASGLAPTPIDDAVRATLGASAGFRAGPTARPATSPACDAA